MWHTGPDHLKQPPPTRGGCERAAEEEAAILMLITMPMPMPKLSARRLRPRRAAPRHGSTTFPSSPGRGNGAVTAAGAAGRAVRGPHEGSGARFAFAGVARHLLLSVARFAVGRGGRSVPFLSPPWFSGASTARCTMEERRKEREGGRCRCKPKGGKPNSRKRARPLTQPPFLLGPVR